MRTKKYNLSSTNFGKGVLFENFADICNKHHNTELVSKVCRYLTGYQDRAVHLHDIKHRPSFELASQALFEYYRNQINNIHIKRPLSFQVIEFGFERKLATHTLSVLHAIYRRNLRNYKRHLEI